MERVMSGRARKGRAKDAHLEVMWDLGARARGDGSTLPVAAAVVDSVVRRLQIPRMKGGLNKGEGKMRRRRAPGVDAGLG